MMFEELLPLACRWVEEQERGILRDGLPLNQEQLEIARKIGIRDVRRIRLLEVDQVPEPDDPVLQAAAEAAGLISLLTSGLTARYGILIRSDYWGNRRLLAHELAHVAQYERLGGIEPFLRCYLTECLNTGYPNGELEQEAKAVEKRFI
jgi:hypothetical protein